MPDHVHCVFLLRGNDSLDKVIGSFSKFTARRINQFYDRRGRFWQHGFYERMVRNDEELYNQLCYISENPVRAGDVTQAEEWPWCELYPDW
jgi:putative transposase